MENIAVIGAGLIGRAWAIVFARAGHPVALYDLDPSASERAHALIAEALVDLAEFGLIEERPTTIQGRIAVAPSISAAVERADYVQENTAENLAVKRAVFAEMDAHAPREAVLASSTSFIPASEFSRDLAGKHRCLVAHPVNPPHLVPVVEIAPAPWTDAATVDRTRALQTKVKQVPVVLTREAPGFILNRLQAVLLAEAFRLVDSGLCTITDLDKTLADGLALRWSFMGPFETIDLNAPGGVADYAQRFAASLHAIDASPESAPRSLSAEFFARVHAERRAVLPIAEHAAREKWRDRRLMALVAHKRALARDGI